ncbi:CIR protein PIR protein [Plasmodium vinckei]|uniref:CIR protein PIR protein n=1 Tax=Plasmodium vinckei TaxID=5860 RepID=A0A6V7T6X4_PLAVN|nr:CIR protein PIR protein [Plasmodium vinckei]
MHLVVKKDILKDTPAALSQPGKGGNKNPLDRSEAAQNNHTTKPQKQDLQYLPQSPNQPADNQQKPSSLSVLEPTLGNNQESSGKSPKDTSSKQADSGNMMFQNILSGVKNTFEKYRSPVYKTLTNFGNILYEKASSTLESVYDKSINFASNTISYVNEQLNKALDNSQPSKENESEPSPSLPKDKKPEPQNIQTPTPGGQSNDNLQESPPTQNIGSPNSKQVNPSDSPPEKQPQSSVDPSSKTPSLTIETGNTGTIVKENTPKLVKIKDIYRGYNRPEIVITVILIPIILLIVYKYLSSVWRKESRRKKNLKKIINSIGGKRPVQIIIKPSSRKKQTKKSINFAYREKLSLLNIYKLMQADPVPFINLFFLLIFFVYKRQLNYLEL